MSSPLDFESYELYKNKNLFVTLEGMVTDVRPVLLNSRGDRYLSQLVTLCSRGDRYLSHRSRYTQVPVPATSALPLSYRA